MKKHILLMTLVAVALAGNLSWAQNVAQETDEISSLKAKISQNDKGLSADLEKLSAIYLVQNDFDGFCLYLNSLLKEGLDKSPEVYFYLASTRQQEILHWQKIKNWEGVYDKASGFKKEIAENLDKAQSYVKDNPNLLLGIKYLKWQRAKEDDPDSSAGLFNDLVKMAKEQAPSEATMAVIKNIADDLSALEDKNLSRRLYEVYVAGLTASHLSKEELKAEGERFLAQGNAYLAKSLFDIYFDQLSLNKEELAKALVDIANKFAHQGHEDGVDPFYAEKLYQRAFDLEADKAFDRDSQYLRAFNLERMKEYERAFEEYKNLVKLYPDSGFREAIYFRLGILAAYAKKDLDTAEAYFTKLKYEGKPSQDTYALSALYQLGLLHQWKEAKNKDEAPRAKEFYETLLADAKASGIDLDKNELVLLTQERLKELEANKEFKYGLRLFFEGTFNAAPSATPLSLSVDLTGRPAKAAVNQAIKFSVTTSNPQTGCMTPTYAYEWSGEVGNISNIPNSPELETAFVSAGIKVTYAAVVGPQGPEGVGFEMAEINEDKT